MLSGRIACCIFVIGMLKDSGSLALRLQDRIAKIISEPAASTQCDECLHTEQQALPWHADITVASFSVLKSSSVTCSIGSPYAKMHDSGKVRLSDALSTFCARAAMLMAWALLFLMQQLTAFAFAGHEGVGSKLEEAECCREGQVCK